MLNWDDPLAAPTSKTRPAAKPAGKPTERTLHPEANPLHAQQAVRKEAPAQQAPVAGEAAPAGSPTRPPGGWPFRHNPHPCRRRR